MATCEDYPCCGHTDGLGCDWVSPNEITPCLVCIDARKSYPYHDSVSECPTERERAIAEVIAGAKCEYYDEADHRNSCEGEFAQIMYGDKPVCYDCYTELRNYDRDMQEQYN